jgi:hemerythrin-like metal-binding protein
MAALDWSDSLLLDFPLMDDADREFVVLLACVEDADSEHLQTAWRALVEHTAEHFAREDAWMRTTGFASANSHSVQHHVVLQVMREGLTQAGEGRVLQVREMARQLADWFVRHVQTLDAALALHLRSNGFDPETGEAPARHAMKAEVALP